jgi:hypothetical protein
MRKQEIYMKYNFCKERLSYREPVMLIIICMFEDACIHDCRQVQIWYRLFINGQTYRADMFAQVTREWSTKLSHSSMWETKLTHAP